MEKVDMDLLNRCAIKDAKELDRFPERKMIYHIVKSHFFRVPDIKIDKTTPIHINMSRREAIKTVLEFYQELDNGMYEKAKSIITGTSKIPIYIYDKKAGSLNHYPNNPMVTTQKAVIYAYDKNGGKRRYIRNGRKTIFVPMRGEIEDVYDLSHELAHTMDTDLNTPTKFNSLLGETSTDCIENLMDYYLLRKGKITKNRVIQRRVMKAKGIKKDCMVMLARMELAIALRQNKSLNLDIIKKHLQKSGYTLTEEDIMVALQEVIKERRSMEYISRYIIGDLITSPYFQRIYEQDPNKAKEMLVNFQEKMKKSSPEECIKTFGLNIDMETIDMLINNKIGYVQGIEKEVNKGKESDIIIR